MPPTRPRRIVRRALMALTVVVLLSGYVSGYGVLNWMRGRGVFDRDHLYHVETTVFAPIRWYQNTTLPGAAAAECFKWWSRYRGEGRDESWGEVMEEVTWARRQRQRLRIKL